MLRRIRSSVGLWELFVSDAVLEVELGRDSKAQKQIFGHAIDLSRGGTSLGSGTKALG